MLNGNDDHEITAAQKPAKDMFSRASSSSDNLIANHQTGPSSPVTASTVVRRETMQAVAGANPDEIVPPEDEVVNTTLSQRQMPISADHQMRLYRPQRKKQYKVYMERKDIPGKEVIFFNGRIDGKARYRIVSKYDKGLICECRGF